MPPNIGQIGQPSDFDLFVDWMGVLLETEYGVASWTSSSNSWTLKVTDGSDVTISLAEKSREIALDAPEAILPKVEQLAKTAFERVQASDFGNATWWSITFSCPPTISEASTLHMMQSLGQHKRCIGTWRLGGGAIVSFTQGATEHPPLFANQTVSIVFRSPGPWHGPFGIAFARTNATVIRAALAFITAAPLEGLNVAFYATPAERHQAESLLASGDVPELLVEGLPVWSVLSALAVQENCETRDRVVGALVAYEHALTQRSDGAALVFLVSAIEALSVPNASWRTTRVTKRFQEFLLEACPDKVSEIMGHGNFEQAFGGFHSQREFVEELYARRSHPIHSGHFGLIPSLGGDVDGPIRVGLVSDLVRATIVSFLRRPFTSLCGLPGLDPFVQLSLQPNEFSELTDKANASGEKLSTWLRRIAMAAARSNFPE